MQLLLDTHAVLWWLSGDDYLSENQSRSIADRRNTRFVSAVTIWEISINQSIGKIDIASEYPDVLRAQGFIELPISWKHAQEVSNLSHYHRDPFDRLLIAQARIEDMTLVTSDPEIVKYDVKTV